jgi:hypothetical protein
MMRVRFGWRESRRLDTIGVAGEAGDEAVDDPLFLRRVDLRLGAGGSASVAAFWTSSASAVCIWFGDCDLLRLIGEDCFSGGTGPASSLDGCFTGGLVEQTKLEMWFLKLLRGKLFSR